MRSRLWLVLAACGGASSHPDVANPPPSGDAGSNRASAPPAPKGVDGELAWAKHRFAELGTFDATRHGAELLAWVAPKTKLPVFVTSRAGRCQPGLLARDDADGMTLVVYTDERTVGGDRVRTFIQGDVGEELDLGGSGGDEKRDPDGTWQQGNMWSKSDQGSWGHLSKVTKAYARFAGMWVDLGASCKGAVTELTCSDGHVIACNACTDVAVSVTERPMGMMGRTYTVGPLAIGCPTCPVTSNADLDRLTALLPALDGWIVQDERSGPTLYKRKADCLSGI